jgi:hypothetical protein
MKGPDGARDNEVKQSPSIVTDYFVAIAPRNDGNKK